MRTLLLATLLASVGIADTRAQAPTGVDALLALPPSPGVEALLAPHAGDPRVRQRWRDALTDPDPPRRTAAARMLGVVAARSALGAIVQAARTETHPVPLAEILRTLVIIGSEHSDAIVVGRLSLVPGDLQAPVIATMASLRPAGIPGLFAAPNPLPTSPAVVVAAYDRLLEAAPAAVTELERVIAAHGTEQAIAALANEAARRCTRVAAEVLIAASGRSGSASAVLDWLARCAGHPDRAQADAALVKAYHAFRDAMPPPSGTHALEIALLDRWLGRDRASLTPPPVDAAAQGLSRLWAVSPTAFAVLADADRKALAARLGRDDDRRAGIERARFTEEAVEPSSRGPAVSLLADIPPTMLVDLRRLTGCVVEPVTGDRPAVIVYGADGRPRQATIGDRALTPGCERYAKTLVAIAYGEPTPTGGAAAPNQAILRLDGQWAACLLEAETDGVGRRSPGSSEGGDGGGDFVPPRKTHDQRPIYPDVAVERRVQGSVVIEAVVSPGGCITHARVVRSVPILDLAALQAVSHWRYTPARLGGRPVPIRMTLTVNFEM